MNQKQREFIIDKVETTYKKEKNTIQEELIDEPSLNNYLVAAFLDNSIEFADMTILKQKMRERVIASGTDNSLIHVSDLWGNRRDRVTSKTVYIPAEEIFVIPQNYKDAWNEFNEIRKDVQRRVDDLYAQKETIIMKIQIGSNENLQKLITQVDNLVDLNIMNSQFLLIDK